MIPVTTTSLPHLLNQDEEEWLRVRVKGWILILESSCTSCIFRASQESATETQMFTPALTIAFLTKSSGQSLSWTVHWPFPVWLQHARQKVELPRLALRRSWEQSQHTSSSGSQKCLDSPSWDAVFEDHVPSHQTWMGGTTNYFVLLWLPVHAKSVIRSCAACSEDLTATTHFQVDSYQFGASQKQTWTTCRERDSHIWQKSLQNWSLKREC